MLLLLICRDDFCMNFNIIVFFSDNSSIIERKKTFKVIEHENFVLVLKYVATA